MRKIELSKNHVTLTTDHYTLSNGFLSPAYGEVQIKFNDLLSVELVKRRSKKILYTMLIPGGILVFAMGFADITPPAILAILAVAVGIMALAYLFSTRSFVEITSMKGTFLVAAQQKDEETKAIVTQLQKRINP